jgi:cytochrome c-type biogenesis protein CcmH/NrfG
LSVGASGAIFGIAGALIPAMLLAGNKKLRQVLKGRLISIFIFVAYSLVAGNATTGTDNSAHVGGLLTGLFLGVVFPTGLSAFERKGRARVIAGTVLLLLTFTGAGVFAVHHNEAYVEIDRASQAHDRGDLSAAVAYARRAVQLKPDMVHAQFMLGTLLLDQQQYADAVEPFTAVTRLRSNWGAPYVNLCVAQRELKMLKEALANCEQGASLSPDETESWFNLGRVRYDLNDLTGARDALAKAVALNPQGFDENLQYALMLITTGETDKAVPYLQKAHELHPDDLETEKLLRQAQHSQLTNK